MRHFFSHSVLAIWRMSIFGEDFCCIAIRPTLCQFSHREIRESPGAGHPCALLNCGLRVFPLKLFFKAHVLDVKCSLPSTFRSLKNVTTKLFVGGKGSYKTKVMHERGLPYLKPWWWWWWRWWWRHHDHEQENAIARKRKNLKNWK